MSPFKPKKPCSYHGCPKITSGRFCSDHEALDKKKQQEYDKERDQSEERQWIHSQRWRDARNAFLAEHPICMECERQGRDTVAYLVDHIIPHNGNYELFWDQSNWQSMCNPHHEEKHIGDRYGK